ncbi:PorV/PorQ family protein [candidate division KSB1 bacterium]|nr:PorV/PorQ family protein [candidate division KSB1 bacterium]
MTFSYGQKPYRVGTTAANFLEVGIGGAGNAMGEAYVGMEGDLASIYWNPAGLGFMEKSEAQFVHQPWVVDISTEFAGVGLTLPKVGTLGFGVIYMGYGDMKVTTLDRPKGTGEFFTANEYAFHFSYSRRLAQWFSFGVTGKYISSQIWHTSANALAVDLGVIVKTYFFSPTGQREDGLNIGVCISNYGTRMKYDGIDLLRPIDIAPDEEGNYEFAPGKFDLEAHELPLIFRLGVAVHPVVFGNHKLTITTDALHPNNNSEHINVGAQYSLDIPGISRFYLRGGYKALFMDESEFGPTFGGGFIYWINRTGFKLDYAYRSVGILGNVHSYSFGFLF